MAVEGIEVAIVAIASLVLSAIGMRWRMQGDYVEDLQRRIRDLIGREERLTKDNDKLTRELEFVRSELERKNRRFDDLWDENDKLRKGNKT